MRQKTFKLVLVFTILLSLVMAVKCANAQNPPQKINNWYEFLGESNDSLFQLPAKLVFNPFYRVPRLMYYNVADSLHIHLWTGHNDISIGGGGGSGTVIGFNIGAVDSLSPSTNGGNVINSTSLPVLYLQTVRATGTPGLLTTLDYNSFVTTYKYFRNSIGTNFVAYPDTPVHSFASAADNQFIGSDPGLTATTAFRNTGIGSLALASLTTGGSNIAIGYKADNSITSGGDNIALGTSALGNETTASDIIAIGGAALRQENGGSFNVAIGFESMQNCITCNNNTAVGNQSMANCNTCTQNVSIGMLSMVHNTTGSFNTAIGYGANSGVTDGAGNTAIGNLSMDFNVHGSGNTSIGSGAMGQDSVGLNNEAVGVQAITGFGDTNNIAIGQRALFGIYPDASSGSRGSNRTIAIGDSIGYFVTQVGVGGFKYRGCILIGNGIRQVSDLDTSRTNVTIIGNDIRPDTDNIAIVGTTTQAIRLGNGGMTGTAFNALPEKASNMQYVTDSASYVMDDGSYKYKWRKVITGSFSASESGATVMTVSLPTTLGSSGYTVTLTPTSLITAVPFYISAKSTTSFSVTFTSAITGTASFDWSVTQ